MEASMTRAEIARTLHRYADAKQRHDLDAIVALRTEDCFDHNVPLDQRIEGREGIRAYFERFFAAMRDYAAHFDGEAIGDDAAVVWGRWTGTLAGRKLEIPCAFVCTFRDDLLVSDSYYYDAATLARQAGIELGELRGGRGMATGPARPDGVGVDAR
jgi:ketosteroid isomerase-like protein